MKKAEAVAKFSFATAPLVLLGRFNDEQCFAYRRVGLLWGVVIFYINPSLF